MSALFLTGLFLSSLIGLSLGLVGGGGSILTMPILVYFLGVKPSEAVGMSLAVVGVTGFFGSILHYKRNNLDFSAGLRFGVAGIVGAALGSPLTRLVSPNVLMLIFAGLMFFVAISMIWRKQNSAVETVREADRVKAILAGFGVGILTGFLGAGGGFLIVPALFFFGGLPMKKAIGTSLFIISLNCLSGFFGHLSQGYFDLNLTILLSSLALSGAIIGTVLSNKFSVSSLQKAFAVLVLAIAFIITYQNI